MLADGVTLTHRGDNHTHRRAARDVGRRGGNEGGILDVVGRWKPQDIPSGPVAMAISPIVHGI